MSRMMDSCIVADFEWAVTPHPAGRGERFYYLNEILSVGAVRLTRTGEISERFYALVRPDEPDYLYPVILSSLRLDRQALREADAFPEVYRAFHAFVGDCPVYTWGGADRSALTQNLSVKGHGAEDVCPVPTMRDIQPFIAKALELRPPYPSLAATLSSLSLNTEENRHNALSDAEDTARLLAYLEQREEGRIRSLFADGSGAGTSEPVCTTAVGAFRQAKKRRLSCPVCGDRLGTGMWYVLNGTEQIGVCSCERDGKFLCLLNAAEENGAFNVNEAFVPFTDEEQRRRYENARRAARNRYR